MKCISNSLKIAILGCLTLWITAASGQTIVTDRPDQTESAAIVPLGMVQWEGGVLVQWEEDRTTTDWMTPTSLVRLPIHQSLELRWVYNQHRRRSNESALGDGATSDMQVGAKWNLLDGTGTGGHMLALLSHWELPVSGGSGVPSSHKVSVRHNIGPDWALAYNVGALLDDGWNGWMYTLSVGRGLGKGWSVFMEPFGSVTAEGTHLASADAGFTWLYSDRIQWDWSMAVGLNHAFHYQSLGLSVLVGSE